MLPISGLTEEQIEQLIELSEYERRKAKEREIADRAGVPDSEVLLDIPHRSLLLSEPRIGKTDVPILDGDRVKPLSRYSPLAKAIQSRGVHDWAVMVSTPAATGRRSSGPPPRCCSADSAFHDPDGGQLGHLPGQASTDHDVMTDSMSL